VQNRTGPVQDVCTRRPRGRSASAVAGSVWAAVV